MDPALFEIDERGVATITLNRPKQLNAINMAMRDLIWEYLTACRDIPEVKTVVFHGNGQCFSAGADISEFGTSPSVFASREARHERDLWIEMLKIEKPLIAQLHGFCYGAGLELPLFCDLRIAEEGAQFALPEVTLAYIPSAGGTQTLPRTIPAGAATDMVLTGEPIGTENALAWGLVTKVVPKKELREATELAITNALLQPTATIKRRKALLHHET